MKNSSSSIRLGINIDHVATLRQVRGTHYPDPIQAAECAKKAGADLITLHLREDRRHIQEDDVIRLKQTISIPINLEMAVTEEMIGFAEQVKPDFVCLVPEKREELTTEGGLNVADSMPVVKSACKRLANAGIRVSLFIDPEKAQIDAAHDCGAPIIELHTGHYADAHDSAEQKQQLERLISMANYASQKGLIVNAGHGLTLENVEAIAKIPVINELNIGHSIIARAVFVGIESAVKEMKASMLKARNAELTLI